MKPSFFRQALLALATLGALGTAQAALVDRGGGMIYDTTLNITWLADMNYAQTSGYNSAGAMTWSGAATWADDLTYGGYSDWRLPSIGELARLFVTDLGNQSGSSVLDTTGDTAEQIANLALFSNVQANFYWSGSDQGLVGSFAWRFGTLDGLEGYDFKVFSLYAVAVRTGDVAAAVPEPQTLALALLALGAAACQRRSGQRWL